MRVAAISVNTVDTMIRQMGKALPLAKHFGADVYATGSGEKATDIIESYGATAIDYKTEKVADYVAKHADGTGFDVIFDSVSPAAKPLAR